MTTNRLLSALLLGWVLLTTAARTPALDVNPPAMGGGDLGEATAFFTHLVEHATNPIIAKMARDNLHRLQESAPEGKQASETERERRIAEVSLLPQSDHTFVVPALVNKKHLATFLVDTGASYTVITPQLAKALEIHIAEDSPTVPVTTANGVLNAPVVRLKHVTLGGLQVDNVDAVVTNLGETPQLSGLLGMSFFRGMDLSFRQDKLVISR